MGMSDFYRGLRERIGPDLLLIPGVAAVIRDDDGRFLVQQRHDGSWSLPAGAVEPGETPHVRWCGRGPVNPPALSRFRLAGSGRSQNVGSTGSKKVGSAWPSTARPSFA